MFALKHKHNGVRWKLPLVTILTHLLYLLQYVNRWLLGNTMTLQYMYKSRFVKINLSFNQNDPMLVWSVLCAKCYKWLILAHCLVVARLQHDNVLKHNIDDNLQNPKIYLCANFGFPTHRIRGVYTDSFWCSSKTLDLSDNSEKTLQD